MPSWPHAVAMALADLAIVAAVVAAVVAAAAASAVAAAAVLQQAATAMQGAPPKSQPWPLRTPQLSECPAPAAQQPSPAARR